MAKYRKMMINYVGSLSDGTVFDDNEHGTPLTVFMGGGTVMKPIVRALEGMDIGDEASVSIPCEQAYGGYDDKAHLVVARCQVEGGDNLKEGMSIMWRSAKNPQPVAVKVIAANDACVTLDFNHPLAGKDLVYHIKVVDAVP